MIARTQRIETLRQHSLDYPCKGIRSDEGRLLFDRSWLKHQYASSKILRRALAKADMLAQSTLVIEEGALVVGKPCFRELEPQERQELEQYIQYTEPAMDPHWGQDAHMAIDYEKLLQKGLKASGRRYAPIWRGWTCRSLPTWKKRSFTKPALWPWTL